MSITTLGKIHFRDANNGDVHRFEVCIVKTMIGYRADFCCERLENNQTDEGKSKFVAPNVSGSTVSQTWTNAVAALKHYEDFKSAKLICKETRPKEVLEAETAAEDNVKN